MRYTTLQISGFLFSFISLIILSARNTVAKGCDTKADDVECVAIYYPHWHVYPHGESWKGIGWTEYEYVRTNQPRYDGHKVPIKPLLGELNDANPKDVEKEIDLAVASGVDVFLYDWYWYCGVKNMEEALEQGFLKAKNNKKIKFALMWANHHRRDAFRSEPYVDNNNNPWLYSRHSESDMMKVIDYCIEHYFKYDNYWKVEGKLYFNIYQIPHFVKEVGGAKKCRELFAKINKKMRDAGLPEIHWAGMVQFEKELSLAKEAGFDSLTSYICFLDKSPKYKKNPDVLHYNDYADAHPILWEQMSKGELPYSPVACQGMDTTARWKPEITIPLKKRIYPYTGIVGYNTPERFKKLLQDAKSFAKNSKGNPKMVTIYAWNEWGEGGAILPSEADGYKYLDAVREVFKENK